MLCPLAYRIPATQRSITNARPPRRAGGGAMDTFSEPRAARASNLFRWTQLIIGVICMVMIANLQYGWTFFVPDIQKTFHWQRAEIQIAFTLFVLFETWLVPIEGWFVDKWGPKLVI